MRDHKDDRDSPEARQVDRCAGYGSLRGLRGIKKGRERALVRAAPPALAKSTGGGARPGQETAGEALAWLSPDFGLQRTPPDIDFLCPLLLFLLLLALLELPSF
jgi:hypothetical protein